MIKLLWSAAAVLVPTSFGLASGGYDSDTWNKLSPVIQKTLTQESTDGLPVLVYMNGKADLTGIAQTMSKQEKGAMVYKRLRDVAQAAQLPIVQWLDLQGKNYERFYINNMIAFDNASSDFILRLAERSDVKALVADESFEISFPEIEVAESSIAAVESSLTEVGAVRVWNELGVKGEGVVIAGQDTGIQWDHPAIIRQYRGFRGEAIAAHNYNWFDAIRSGSGRNRCGFALDTPCDDNNHGTHTIGTIVGDDGGSNQIGMAPEAEWIGCRNMDAGNGRPSTYIRCYEFFLAPYPVSGDSFVDGRPDLAPDVINNSWGCPRSEGCRGEEMVDVLQAIYEAGIINVVSAGNAGPRCGTITDQPASISDYSLTVGAYSVRGGTIARFSSRGPSPYDDAVGPNVAAPGVSIRSAVTNGRYRSFSGTSMAGPHVVGHVALILSARPELKGNVDAVTQIIEQTARPTTANQTCGGTPGTAIPNNTWGYGKIESFEAVTTAINWQL